MKHVACKNLLNFFFFFFSDFNERRICASGNVKNDVMLKMLLGVVVVMVISTQQ